MEQKIITERVALFCNVFYVPAAERYSEKDTSPLNVLVRKLHLSLNKLENFPVIFTEGSGSATGLKCLTQAFKLKLELGSSNTGADENENVVLIEPLATIQALKDFIRTRLESESTQVLKFFHCGFFFSLKTKLCRNQRTKQKTWI